MATLYRLTEDLTQIMQAIDDEQDQEHIDELIQLQGTIADEVRGKLLNYARLTMHVKGEIDQITTEQERLTARKNRRKNLLESLRERMIEAMKATGIMKVEDALNTINLRAKPAKLEITDESLVPEQFFSMEKKLSKSAVNDWFKRTGEVIPGAAVIDGEYSITIK
jgi:hypothetical protein